MTTRPTYHATIDRNGTEDEITIHAPDGRAMAAIQFWDKGEEGATEAKADAELIVDALNAYAKRGAK